MPAHLLLIGSRAGMESALTTYCATVLIRLRILRQFQMPVPPGTKRHLLGSEVASTSLLLPPPDSDPRSYQPDDPENEQQSAQT